MAIYVPAMSILPFPDPATERERDEARQNPDRETLELAAQGAAHVLGPDHGVTMAFAKASITEAVPITSARAGVASRHRARARMGTACHGWGKRNRPRRSGAPVGHGGGYPSRAPRDAHTGGRRWAVRRVKRIGLRSQSPRQWPRAGPGAAS